MSQNLHCSRAIKKTSLRSNHPIFKQIAQLRVGYYSDKRIYSSPSGWSLKFIQKELEEGHTGWLDSTNSLRSKVEVFHSTTLSSDRTTKARHGEVTSTIKRNKRALPKESDCSNNPRWNRIYQPSFCHT